MVSPYSSKPPTMRSSMIFESISRFSSISRMFMLFALIAVDKCDFTDKVRLQFAVKKDKSELIVKRIMELSGGKLAPEFTGERFDKDKKR
jgi:hypothetical protein